MVFNNMQKFITYLPKAELHVHIEGTLSSQTILKVAVIGINIRLKFVEEKELIERFGQDYRDYKKKVPIIVKPLKIPILFKFILSG